MGGRQTALRAKEQYASVLPARNTATSTSASVCQRSTALYADVRGYSVQGRSQRTVREIEHRREISEWQPVRSIVAKQTAACPSGAQASKEEVRENAPDAHVTTAAPK